MEPGRPRGTAVNRRRWVVWIPVIAGLMIGVLVGTVLFDTQQDTAPLSDTAPRPDTASESDGTPEETAPQRQTAPPQADPVSVSAGLESSTAWALIAGEDLARRRPPDDVTSCRTLFTWAVAGGAALIFESVHVLTVRAAEDVHVELLGIEARQQPVRTGTSSEPPARFMCQPDSASSSAPQEKETLPRAPTTPAGATGAPPTFFDEFRLPSEGEVRVRFFVEPLIGPGQYEYLIVATLRINGVEKTFELEAGGQPFRQSEDGGGMGYAPPSYTWTFSPEPSYMHCPEVRQPEFSPPPVCSHEIPR
jgi:hypothetical protein